MHATHPTNASIETVELPIFGRGEVPHQTLLDALNEIEGVCAGYPASGVEVCYAHGCHNHEKLSAVIINGFGKRTLCPYHAKDLVVREVEIE